MTATDYDALHDYLERWCQTCGGTGSAPVYGAEDGRCPFCHGTGRISDGPSLATPTHRFNHDDDRKALVTQADEAARLLGMYTLCGTCQATGTYDLDNPSAGLGDCPECDGYGFSLDGDTPAIDRLAIADIGPRIGSPDGIHEGWWLPTAPCETCDDTGEVPTPNTHYVYRGDEGLVPHQTDTCSDCDGAGRWIVHEYQSVSADVCTVD